MSEPRKIANRMREIIQDVWDKKEGYTDRQAWSDLHGQALQLLGWEVASREDSRRYDAATLKAAAEIARLWITNTGDPCFERVQGIAAAILALAAIKQEAESTT